MSGKDRSFREDLAAVIDERAGRISEPEAFARAVVLRLQEDARFARELRRLLPKAKSAGDKADEGDPEDER